MFRTTSSRAGRRASPRKAAAVFKVSGGSLLWRPDKTKNVASIERLTTGIFRITFITAMPDPWYMVSGSGRAPDNAASNAAKASLNRYTGAGSFVEYNERRCDVCFCHCGSLTLVDPVIGSIIVTDFGSLVA